MKIIDINQEQQRTQHGTLGDTMTNLPIELELELKMVTNWSLSDRYDLNQSLQHQSLGALMVKF